MYGISYKTMKTLSVLKNYGLTERQAKVYVACLELGTASVQDISKKIQIARSSCEATLEQLQQRGFVSSFKQKTVRRYSPQDPRQIAKIAEQNATAIAQSLPDMLGLFLKNRTIPAVRMYEGKSGMISILEEILVEAKVLHGFGSADDLFDRLGDIFPAFRKRRIQKKILVKMILKDTPQARERQRMGPKELREVRLVSDVGDFSSLMFMWESKVALFSLREEAIAIVVESKELTVGHRAMFEFMWHALPGYKA